MSFASEPGRDDGNLPPVNIVIPDDARELDRDVLAYHREQRARRRRQRIMRLFGSFGRRESGGHAAILPLIATCVALSLLAGAMLSVITIGPASAPTLAQSPSVSTAPGTTSGLSPLPRGNVWLDGGPVPVTNLLDSVIALVPVQCDCGAALQSLATQAVHAHAYVYFAASGAAMPQLQGLTKTYGDGAAVAVYDKSNVLGARYRPVVLTVLLVHGDAEAEIFSNLRPGFQLNLSDLIVPGS